MVSAGDPEPNRTLEEVRSEPEGAARRRAGALSLATAHQPPGGDQQQDQGDQAHGLRVPGRPLLLPQDQRCVPRNSRMNQKKVVSPGQQRAAADYLAEEYDLSQRRACRLMDRPRSTIRYRPNPTADEPKLVREINRLARRHPRFGYRRIHARLVRHGWTLNLKRVHRLWGELGLKRPVRLRRTRKIGPKPGTSENSCVKQLARLKNDVWTCDFIHDRTASGSPLKWLTLVDEYTRECLVLHADDSLTGPEVRRIVARVIGRRGAPTRIRSDNGSEFIC